MNLDDKIWSFSSLHTYEQCPYSFYLKYIEKRQGESNFYAENGQCMHEVFEGICSGRIDVEDCTEAYADKYGEICYTTKKSIMDNTFEKCMDYLCGVSVISPEYEVLGTEIELRFKIGKYSFVGYADLVVRNRKNGEVILVDHKQASHFLKKDGTPLKTQQENYETYKKQMYLYCKGLRECMDLTVNKIVWHHFKDDGKLTIIPFNTEDYVASIEWATNTIEQIKKDVEFCSKESYMMCFSLCEYRNDCEYKDEGE